MDFGFSREQESLRDVARELFEKESPPSRLRELWTSDAPRDERAWRRMADVGLLGITAQGGDEVDLVLVLEEAGRAALPEPLLDAVAVAAPAFAEAGRTELLDRLATGDSLVVAALGGPYVCDADVADVIVVERDGALHAVPRDAIAARRVPSMDRARRLFAIDVTTGPHTRLNADVSKAHDRGAVATAAMLNGLAMRLLDMTLEHVRTRTQFDRPIGSFQAVKHKLASVFTQLEAARAATWYAAYAIARDLPDRSVAAAAAKAAAAEAEALANTEALQCHGGIGFTWEHDLHLWLKRGIALRAQYGSAQEHRARLAQHLFDTEGTDG